MANWFYLLGSVFFLVGTGINMLKSDRELHPPRKHFIEVLIPKESR